MNRPFTLTPYIERHFPERFLVDAYTVLKQEKSLDWLFDGEHTISLNSFICRLSAVPVAVTMALPGYETVGLTWLYEVRGTPEYRMANIGGVALARWWGKRWLQQAALAAMAMWRDQLRVQRYFATVDAENRSALRFAHNLGFAEVGRLPQYLVRANARKDALLLTLEAKAIEGPPWDRTPAARKT